MTETPGDILKELAEIYQQKEDDYGASWKKTGEVLHLLADGRTLELETPEDYVRLGLYTRRLDKFIRAFNGEFFSEEMNFESLRDSHKDESCYASMHASTHKEIKKGEDGVEATEFFPKHSARAYCMDCEWEKVFTKDNSFNGNYKKSAKSASAGHKSGTDHETGWHVYHNE